MPRMSLDLTVALSKIAGGDYNANDQRLRESTKTVAALAKVPVAHHPTNPPSLPRPLLLIRQSPYTPLLRLLFCVAL